MRVIFICLLLKFSTVNFSLGYDDISAFKATKQQGRQITDVAENAVDRSLSTCSSTDATTPAWWYVDLGKVKSIYDVEVYFRLYNEIYKQRQRERMHGYKLYISNSTDFSLLQKAYLCFSHTGPELPDLNVTHACVSFGRYVIFYNERDEGVTYPNGVNPIQRYIQLCEVVVQGCDNGTVYGSFCNKTCPTNCQERRCYITNGTCAGCKDGWIGEKCLDACPAGKYGAECKNTCADHCGNNTSCNHVTGYCEGCLSGWMGDDCNEKCSDGTYGIMCNETCRGHCMDNQTCHHVNGHCTQGCQAGYKGEKCDSKCDQGNFGKNCLQNCSLNCVDNCDKINGHCKCNKGWRGENCSEACSSGQFGHNCEEICNCLNNEQCNIINGSCPSGCQENYEGHMCQKIKGSAVKTSETNQENATYGAIGGVVAVVVMVVVVVVVFIWRRKARPERKEIVGSKQTLEFAVHNTSEEKLTYNEDEMYSNKNEIPKRNNFNRKQGCIQIKDLWTTIRKLSLQENAGFKEEYMEIPKGELHPCEVGKREENKDKNRYTTTFPYDHTRIILRESIKNDGYINANYIKDASGEKKYIATQGPRKKTVVDFWEMVWQEEVTTIVCLTNLREGTREKCKQYWPNKSEKIQHGHLTIRNTEEKSYANHMTRKFHVQNVAENKERNVRMFHYTQWTDHGVPEAINLVFFHRHFLRSVSGNSIQPKVLVHCSAGVGRTGTFIALDALYRDGLNQGSVNVQEYVTQMRHDRMNMVQGEDQYKMVYAALYESFRGDLRPVDADTFLSQYQNSSCYINLGEVANKKTPVEDQFKELSSLNPHSTTKYGKSGHTNLGPIFTDSDEEMSGEKYKCCVLSDDEKPVHYNAVVLQSFTKPDGIISASYPTENQSEDFLYVVRGSGASTVVLLGKLSDITSTKFWFPTKNETKVVGSFTVKMRICTPSDSFTKTNIIIQKKGFKDVAVSVLECNFWREDTVTADCQKVLDVIAEARLEETTHPNSRLLVLSSDGAKRCGPFCVAYNTIEQLILDKEVDIFTATRLVQIRRPDMVSTTEEFQFCHDLIAEYLQNHMVYANYSS